MTVLINALNDISTTVVTSLWRAAWQGGIALLLVFLLCRMVRPIPAAAEGVASSAEQTPEMTVEEQPASASPKVHGIVRDDAGVPIPGATIVAGLHREGDIHRQTLLTDANGRFVMQLTYEQRPLVLAHKVGYSVVGTWLMGGEFQSPDAKPLELILSKPAPFVGRVQDPSGNPIADASVRIELFTTHPPGESAHWNHVLEIVLADTELDNLATTTTNSQGEFRLSHLPRGARAMLKVKAAGMGLFRSMMYYNDWDQQFLAGTSDHPAIVTLQPEGVIDGRLVTALEGVSVEGLTVHLQGTNRSAVIAEPYFVKTDAEGGFRFSGLVAGTANVFLVDHEPDGPWTYRAAQDVEIHAGERSEVRIELIKGAIVAGEVVDFKGNPITGVGVGVYGPIRPRSGAAIISDETSEDGTYRFHLPPGEAYIYAAGVPEGYRMHAQTLVVPEGEGVVQGPTLVLALVLKEALKRESQFSFSDTPLKDIATYISKILDAPIEIAEGVDQKATVQIEYKGTLKGFFEAVLPPMGLEYQVDAMRILIRTKNSDG